MDKNELKAKIDEVFVDGKPNGLEIFTVLKEGKQRIMKKFLTTDPLNDRLSDLVKKVIMNNYYSDDIELDVADNISDNKNDCIYEIPMTDSYAPFSFIKDYHNILEQYNQKDLTRLMGFLFRLNFNDNHIWAYQHVYPYALIQRSGNRLFISLSKNNTYEELKGDILSIGSRIDLLIIDDQIFTGNIKLLQSRFGFEQYVRKEAMETINLIVQAGLIKNPKKLLEFSEKEELTNATKLMKAKKSPVFRIEKTELFNRIVHHHIYKSKINIENDEIQLKLKDDIDNFLKLLNDDFLKSELTQAEYDSVSKKALDPI
ncbi:DUF4868 domain-containing protein [Methanomicrobium mobile]|uniref:DUF4868 domain-containing protein n=1 Tax=Methanomicrobium mobile TaxID=2205 RepID=UPI0005B258F8|nr:DUF4868 domain-containing protein [Methanomicrobium mobile]